MASERLNIYGNKFNIEKAFDKIRGSTISERNKALLIDFCNHCLCLDISPGRVIKYSWILRKLAIKLDLDYDKATKKDLMQLNAKISTMKKLIPHKYKTGKSEMKESDKVISANTASDYRIALKRFYKWLKGNDEESPPEIKWLKTGIKLKDHRLVDEIITPDEIREASQVCDNDRDRAFVNVLYETGCRIDEMLNIRIRDFQFKDSHAKVSLIGKTGQRYVMIVSSVPFISNYLNNHPSKEDPQAFFWQSISPYHKGKPLNYVGAVKLLRRVFTRAGVKKKIKPHLFRHSRATELASHLTEVQMCLHFGWVLGSGMVRTYVHANGRETEGALLRYYGIEPNKETEQPKNLPLNCAICEEVNEYTNRFCKKCGKALTIKTAIESEETIKEETSKTFELLMEISKNPKLIADFENFRKEYLKKEI